MSHANAKTISYVEILAWKRRAKKFLQLFRQLASPRRVDLDHWCRMKVTKDRYSVSADKTTFVGVQPKYDPKVGGYCYPALTRSQLFPRKGHCGAVACLGGWGSMFFRMTEPELTSYLGLGRISEQSLPIRTVFFNDHEPNGCNEYHDTHLFSASHRSFPWTFPVPQRKKKPLSHYREAVQRLEGRIAGLERLQAYFKQHKIVVNINA